MRNIRTVVGATLAASAALSAVFLGETFVAQAQSSPDAVVPYRIDVPDAVMRDLKDRLERTCFPSEIEGLGWDYGRTWPT